MEEPRDLPSLTAELSLRSTAEGGRRQPVFSGYRPQAVLDGAVVFPPGARTAPVVFNDCQLNFDDGSVKPGSQRQVRVYPFHPEFWENVRVGDIVGLYEGYHLIGTLRMLSPLEQWVSDMTAKRATRDAKPQQTRFWRELVSKVSASLYEWDPDGMGASVGTPQDEYHSVATGLISKLECARTRSAFDEAARDVFPTAPDAVVDDWWTAFSNYWGIGNECLGPSEG